MAGDLDRTDLRILGLLQNNARVSNKELAAEVGLAESSCLERVRRLERRGVIRGAHAEVDPAALGIQLQAMVLVRLRKHSRELVQAFRDHIMTIPEVRAAFLVAGQHDFMIHVAVPSSDHLRDLELNEITIRPEVVHLETALIFEVHNKHVLPAFVGE